MANREIKFRAWDELVNKMAIPDTLPFSLTSADIFKRWSVGNIMQFTGLKDKNGVEIYESDIVTYQDCIYQIRWMDSKACFSLDGVGQFKKFMDVMATVHDGSFTEHTANERFEVIGNIYESPELLSSQPAQAPEAK